MDDEAIVDQIVRSLSFEVVAGPQNVTQVESTSKSTPLNVKIRVRKKHGAELRHGVLSMPKVDAKNDSRKIPDRVRLVSSDQTIMNFNVLMEADVDKMHYKQNMNIVPPGLEINNEVNQNLFESANDFHTVPIISKRNKDIFGRCKPGGCLDPPYGEEKYAYQPPQQNISVQEKDDTYKMRSSSIFKNYLFKKKKKGLQVEAELKKFDPDIKNEIISTTKLTNEIPITISPYCSSIITYPHPTDCNEFYKPEENKFSNQDEHSSRKRYSSSERSKASSVEEGSYYMKPKKNKKLSTQILQKEFTKSEENNAGNVITSGTIPEREVNNNETKHTSQDHTFDPLSLIVSKNIIKSVELPKNEISISELGSDLKDTVKQSNEFKETININKLKEADADDTNKLSLDEKTLLVPDLDTHSKNYLSAKIDNDSVTGLHDILDNENLQVKPENIFDENRKKRMSSLSRIENNISKLNNVNESDFKSDLADAREKSLLNVTTDINEQIESNPTNRNVFEQMESKSMVQNVQYSTQDLNEIWENCVESPKSRADVITTITMLPLRTNNNLEIDDTQDLSIKTVSDSENEGYINTDLEKNVEDTNENINNSMTQTSQQLLKVSATNFQIAPKTSTQTSTIEAEDTEDAINVPSNIMNKSINSYTNLETISSVQQEQLFDNTHKISLQTDHIENTLKSETSKIMKQNTRKISNTIQFEESQDLTDQIKKESDTEINETAAQNNGFKKQPDKKELFSEEISEANSKKINESSITSNFENEDVTVKNLKPYKSNQSASDQSILANESTTYMSSNIENKNSKIMSSGDFQETVNKENSKKINRVSDVAIALEEIPTLSSDLEKNMKTQLAENINNETITKLNEIGCIQSRQLSEALNIDSQPTLIHRTGTVPWKMDIALQSYVDENNERIIKSFDSKNVPERRPNDAFLVARCYLADESNEIKIPIDQDNDLRVKVVHINKPQQRTIVEFNNIVQTIEETEHVVSNFGQHSSGVNERENEFEKYGQKKIKIDSNVTEVTDYEEQSSKANAYNKAIMKGDIRSALNSIYEEELIPLQLIIKGLREEIDVLIANKIKLNTQDNKRTKPVRLSHPYKKCCCFRRF